MSARMTVAVDFDGVLHRYDSPWVAPHVIPDAPVAGAIEWLHRTLQHFDVYVFSTRCKSFRGRLAVRSWIKKHAGDLLWYENMGARGLEDVRVSHKKMPAVVYVDDRGYRFTGDNWPDVQALHSLRPWNKRK